jgi:hypothetical protein
MATAKRIRGTRRVSWISVGLALVLAGSLGWWLLADTISGYARAGTAYGARNACSCRHISGRELASCRADFVPGMELVLLSEDEDARSVTASIPLVHAETATFREGFGCVLEPLAD